MAQVRRLALAAAMVAGAAMGGSASGAMAAELEVTVAGVSSNTGKVVVAIYDALSAQHYPSEVGVRAGNFARAKTGDMRFLFVDLPPGQYAAVAFHDLNDNDRLDTDGIGLPREPFGFSQDPGVLTGPPSFQDAAVTIGAGQPRAMTTATLVQ